ncbi:MAG: hypothetical protein ACLRWL_00540 [Evtepia gabavorous]
MVVSIGIDVSKDKDCFILSSEGEVWRMHSYPQYNGWVQLPVGRSGLHTPGQNESRVEATGHYSYNLLGFFLTTA